jgi:hypothetical protein
MPGKTARSPDQTSFGTAGTPEATAQPTCGFPETPPSAIVHTVPEFIWEMSGKLLLSELRAEITKGLADREAGRVADSIPKS